MAKFGEMPYFSVLAVLCEDFKVTNLNEDPSAPDTIMLNGLLSLRKAITAEKEEVKRKNLCPYCKTPLVLRKGKYGDFYGCSNYPKCKYTGKV